MHVVAGSVPRAIASGSPWRRTTRAVKCARYVPRRGLVQCAACGRCLNPQTRRCGRTEVTGTVRPSVGRSLPLAAHRQGPTAIAYQANRLRPRSPFLEPRAVASVPRTVPENWGSTRALPRTVLIAERAIALRLCDDGMKRILRAVPALVVDCNDESRMPPESSLAGATD